MDKAEIERQLNTRRWSPSFTAIKARYEELLAIIGNVEGDEIIALVLLADETKDYPT